MQGGIYYLVDSYAGGFLWTAQQHDPNRTGTSRAFTLILHKLVSHVLQLTAIRYIGLVEHRLHGSTTHGRVRNNLIQSRLKQAVTNVRGDENRKQQHHHRCRGNQHHGDKHT